MLVERGDVAKVIQGGKSVGRCLQSSGVAIRDHCAFIHVTSIVVARDVMVVELREVLVEVVPLLEEFLLPGWSK